MTDQSNQTARSSAIAAELRILVARLVRQLRTEAYSLPSHHVTVMRIIEAKGPRTASQLAVAEGIRPQSMAHTLRQLDSAGFISREPDPADRRQTLVALTAAGADAMLAQQRDVTDWLSRRIEQELDLDEQGRAAEGLHLLMRVADGATGQLSAG